MPSYVLLNFWKTANRMLGGESPMEFLMASGLDLGHSKVISVSDLVCHYINSRVTKESRPGTSGGILQTDEEVDIQEALRLSLSVKECLKTNQMTKLSCPTFDSFAFPSFLFFVELLSKF
ncbi:hypothetical protein ACTXT7_006260 [Hymenolepis weldensis]